MIIIILSFLYKNLNCLFNNNNNYIQYKQWRHLQEKEYLYLI
jgi:hypothetical protein